MKKLLLLLTLIVQNNLTAQDDDSKLMQLNKRKEIKSDFNPDFFLRLIGIYPNFNDNELLIIEFYPKSEKCTLNLVEEEMQQYTLEFQQKVNKVTEKKTICIVENQLNKNDQNDYMSEIINKLLLTQSYHCYNRILVYKNKFIALLGDYNDDEALQRIKKLIK